MIYWLEQWLDITDKEDVKRTYEVDSISNANDIITDILVDGFSKFQVSELGGTFGYIHFLYSVG